jgi:S1-C subfamily serine protease/regulation of enolase protein 1 (concanavalin A-like superfamily)
MPTTFTCPKCGVTGRLPEGFSGDRVRCPSCKTVSPLHSNTYGLAEPEPAAPPKAPRPPSTPPELSPSRPKTPGQRAPASTPGARVPIALIAGAGGGGALLAALIGLFVIRSLPPAGPAAQPPAAGDPKAVPPAQSAAPAPAAQPTIAAEEPATESASPSPEQTDAAPSASRAATRSSLRPNGLLSARRRAIRPGQLPPPPRPFQPPEQTQAQKELVSAKSPEDASTNDLVKRIQDATVYLKVQSGRMRGSGSGFVIQSDRGTLLIATNDHVVDPSVAAGADDDDSPRPTSRASITAVLRSGSGPGIEQSLPAKVVAFDHEGSCDLAILQIRGVRNPPEPIPLVEAPEPALTMPLLIYGYPLGNLDAALDPSVHRNPSITVNKGSVSSLKRDRWNKLSLIQIDGSVNPGNSGGPVVDEKGRLLGVVVAKINNTNIGFAIPSSELSRMLEGHLGPIALAMRGENSGQTNLDVEVRLIDPLNRIASVEFLYAKAPANPSSADPNSTGSWQALPDAETVNLALRNESASGNFKTAERRLMVQAAYTLASGKVVYGNPQLYVVPSKPTNLARIRVGPKANGRAPVISFAALGPLIDPLKKPVKDSQLQKEPGAFTIQVPAGTHLLSIGLEVKNAPMTLADVEGDFVAQVRVAGGMVPGTDPPRYKGKTLPNTFQGAGIILWQDTKNYIRIERTVRAEKGKIVLTSEALLEIVKGGKLVGFAYPGVPDGPLYLRAERLNGAVRLLFGPDGRRWVPFQKLAIALPPKVQVGLVACNASKQPLNARFEEFVLVTDKKDTDDSKSQ